MDQGLRDGLSVLLCNTQPEWVLESLKGKATKRVKPWVKCCDDHAFLTAFRREQPNRSGIEAANILQSLRKLSTEGESSVFDMILSAARAYLRMEGTEARCRHEKLVEWRLFTQQTGQLPYLCAFLAWSDLCTGFRRTDFSFSPYAKTDHLRLRNHLARGMAENHFHLRAGTPAASLSWLSLMNRIKNRNGQNGFGNTKLKYALSQAYGDYDSAPGTASCESPAIRLYRLVSIAALLRAMLWKYLLHGRMFEADEKGDGDLLDQLMHTQDKPAVTMERLIDQIQSRIDYLRTLSGIPMDYAQQGAGSSLAAYRAFSGEHRLLYQMFRLFQEDPMAEDLLGGWFYAYLLIWIRFRRELSQCNEAYGLDNFIQYQGRKSLFLHGPFQEELIRVAARSALDNPAIHSLEARIVLPPKKAAIELSKAIQCIPESPSAPGSEGGLQAACPPVKKQRDERMFFVIHLPKRREDFSEKRNIRSESANPPQIPYRHQEYRDRKVWPLIYTLVDMLRNSDSNAKLIYGLDACSQEIGCRPEVFAPAFRYARERGIPTGTAVREGPAHSLRLTYHVGEDFLDVADGLRAIEEAVLFLELRAGDRLGHALALGIDPDVWYEKRGGNLFLPAQDVLDNTAWLLRRLRKMNYSDGTLVDQLNDTYGILCRRIYGERYEPVDYSRAWRLRGDDPKYYSTDLKAYPDWMFRISQEEELRRWREQDAYVSDIYRKYHFDAGVRKRGDTCVSYQIPPGYGAAVRAVQRELRWEIAYRRLGIETCPSSNHLIGRFGNYEQHPIVQFNHTYLSGAQEEPALFVSINTDDQGIFDTDLENEYALMACALETAGGNNRSTVEQVLRWIDNIRQMGLEQSFRQIDARFDSW